MKKSLIPKEIDGKVVIINKSDYDSVRLSVDEMEEVLNHVFQKGREYEQKFVEERCKELGIDYTLIYTIHSQ